MGYCLKMKAVKDIVDLWPRQSLIARDLDVPASTVTNWKARGSIPPSYWAGLIASARRHGVVGVTADALVAAHDPESGSGGTTVDDAPVTGFGEQPQAAFVAAGSILDGAAREAEMLDTEMTLRPGETPRELYERLIDTGPPIEGKPGLGHFSRYYHLRRANYTSADAVVAHVRALRDEWDRPWDPK